MNQVGYNCYPDARKSMGAVFMASVVAAPLVYIPDLGEVGHGYDGTYYPRDTSADAAALNFLGFMSDDEYRNHVGTLGSQKADMSQKAGAWAEPFQYAIRQAQGRLGLKEDGWTGPNTRRALAAAVLLENAARGRGALPAPNPPAPSPGAPAVVPVIPGLPQVTPASAKSDDDNTTLYVVGGLVGLGALGALAWWLLD